MPNVDAWLVVMRTILTDMFTLYIGPYPIFEYFLAMACVSVVTSALVLRIKRGA